MTAYELVAARLVEVTGYRPPNDSGAWRCPAHDDNNPSLSMTNGTKGVALHCFAGCSVKDILAALRLGMQDLFDTPSTNGSEPKSRISTTYDYRDEAGELVFQVVRLEPKSFRQRRPDRKGGWTWNLKGTRRVLYRLPELREAIAKGSTVYLTEGEKDADALVRAGQTATCNPGGAGKWRPEYTSVLAEAAHVVVVADKDDAGSRHASTVADALRGHVDRLDLVEAAVGKDAADHLAAGLSTDEFVAVAPASSGHEDGAGGEGAVRQLATRCAASVSPERPGWVWERWLVAGGLNMLPGRQGAGKSTFAAHLVACATTHRTFPDGHWAANAIGCGYLSHEEPDGRVTARLAAAGAALDRVQLLGLVEDVDDDGRRYSRPWQLPADCDVLAERIRADDLGLVVVDGLGYSIRGDSHNYAVVGSALAGLAAVAESTGCAILGLTHPPKGASDPVTAAIGSTAWTAIPRVVIVLGRHPDDETVRVVRVAKTNFQQPDHGWSFSISGDEKLEVGYVTELKTCDVAAGALVAEATSAEERDDASEAKRIVETILDDNLPMPAKDFEKEAAAAGLTERQVKAGRRKAGVVAERQKDETGKVIGWTVKLPDHQGTRQRTHQRDSPFPVPLVPLD